MPLATLSPNEVRRSTNSVSIELVTPRVMGHGQREAPALSHDPGGSMSLLQEIRCSTSFRHVRKFVV
eukprot:14347542-Alexandrium_andersonii.AAC.1